MILSDRASKFLSKKPVNICTVLGVAFYEHPTRGDEAPLFFITSEGELRSSGFYEMPQVEDVMDLIGAE